MWDWLLLPIDPARLHLVSEPIAWHGRVMVLSWGVLLPLGVLAARFFKVMPRQDWPQTLDNRTWWTAHLGLQYLGGLLMLAGFVLVLSSARRGALLPTHGLLGYAVLTLGACQYLAGWLRGSKGGPTEPRLSGDHYDMTLRRRVFELLHKTLGYVALLTGYAAIFTGLWRANAPHWMWLVLLAWIFCLVGLFALLQRRGRAIDTYQAIWGPDPKHPGNALPPISWGIRRLPAPTQKRSHE